MLKRLIEVALPLKEVSEQSAREKSIRHGHVSTLHIWWARRPLAACRAVVFASLIPDPDDPECPADAPHAGAHAPEPDRQPGEQDQHQYADAPRGCCGSFVRRTGAFGYRHRQRTRIIRIRRVDYLDKEGRAGSR